MAFLLGFFRPLFITVFCFEYLTFQSVTGFLRLFFIFWASLCFGGPTDSAVFLLYPPGSRHVYLEPQRQVSDRYIELPLL